MDVTGTESPQSVNITFYYKGFSVGVTKRRDDVDIAKLLTDAMNSIDWAIKAGMQPSWNADTNKQVAQQVTVKPAQLNVDGCPDCGSPLVSGVTKNGKKYQKCSTQKYDYMSKSTTGCDYVNWNV